MQLLVSVQNSREAMLAARAGVPIIDIKAPDQGSLGKAADDEIDRCCAAARSAQPQTVLSAALGELADWQPLSSADVHHYRQLDFVKFGLAGLGRNARWERDFQEIQAQFQALMIEQQRQPPGWVAVAYVDHELAAAPLVDEVIAVARRLNCCGVLFDTYCKQQGTCFDWIRFEQLLSWAETCRAAGMFVAVAGRLTGSEIAALDPAAADIVGVRSAACADGVRNGSLSPDRIRQLLTAVAAKSIDGSRSGVLESLLHARL